MTAFTCGFTASMRSSRAVVSSRAEISRARIAAAAAVADSKRSMSHPGQVSTHTFIADR
jgi:hypothetical protein